MFTDRPIEKIENDILDRAAFSRMIGDILMSTGKNESLCVGLMGSWGSGKTSVINMAVEYIETEERTPHISVMRFEPWNFTKPDQVISQFLLQLAEFFGVDNTGKGEIGEAIANYASGIETSTISTLLSAAPPFGPLLSGLIKLFGQKAGKALKDKEFQNKSIQKQKDEIQELFKNIEEKVIIVIDDIDRLTDEQIRCVFQLVTIVCKFPNVNYLLSFDRSVVTKALDKVQDMRGDEFLDKVIQVPISMPLINKNKLFSIMSTQLVELILAYKIKKPDESKWQELYGYCMEHLIITQRDVLRLCNGLNSKMIMMSNDVDFADLAVLTIIEQHEPQLYEWIKQHGQMLTGQLTYEDVLDHGYSDQEKHKRKERYKQEIESILRNKDRFTAEFAIETLCILFPSFNQRVGGYHGAYGQEKLRKENCVGHSAKFDRYFSLNMEAGQISNNELLYIINEASVEEINEKIIEKDQQGTAVELFDEILARNHNLNIERVKTIICSLQATGDSLKSESSNGLFARPASSEAAYVINEMLRNLSKKDRYNILYDMVSRMDISTLNIVSIILNRVSIAHNRIMDDEQTDVYSKYPSLESDNDYLRIERRYKDKVKDLREGMDAFEVIGKPNFIHFYKRFPVGKTYIKKKIKTSPQSILYYLHTTIGGWHRIGGKEIEEIEIKEKYKEFVSRPEVNRSIHDLIESREFENLDIDQQRSAVAFLISQEDKYSGNSRLYMFDVEKRRKELLETMEPKINLEESRDMNNEPTL